MMKLTYSTVSRQFDFATLLHPVVVLLLGTPPVLLPLLSPLVAKFTSLYRTMQTGGIQYGRA